MAIFIHAYIKVVLLGPINGKRFTAIDRCVTIEIAARAFIFRDVSTVLYCVAPSRETELIAMHRYHASFSAIAPAGVASVRVESIIGVEEVQSEE